MISLVIAVEDTCSHTNVNHTSDKEKPFHLNSVMVVPCHTISALTCDWQALVPLIVSDALCTEHKPLKPL